jgi:hypothetical protein
MTSERLCRTVACLLFAAATSFGAATCESLTGLKLPSTSITAAQAVDAGAFTPPTGPGAAFKNLPAFCRVQGVIAPYGDSHIEFEVWLPASGWNGKYLGVGNGGFAGAIYYPGLAAVGEGYVVSSTDTGHKGSAIEAEWALGHFEKIVDFGYRAIHETAEKSKAIVAAFYGENPKHSYFSGCSNGGRQALIEAQRYPADYDGILAGAPANDFTHLLAGFAWNDQALTTDPASFIPAKKMQALENATVAACDGLDGVKDGVIGDPTRCHFDPSVLACKGADSDTCFTDPQIAALKKVYAGPRNSKGEQIFPGYQPGGEGGLGGWGSWITGITAGKSLQHSFGQGLFADMAFQNASWNLGSLNFDRDLKMADDKVGPILNGTNADLKAFKNRGGKLILYHGWSDAAIAPTNAINYYRSVAAKLGPRHTTDFIQLYMVPGMQHCGGGPGPNDLGVAPRASADPQHSISLALERWVESGVAPERIIATKHKADANPASEVVRTRPLCPFPQSARYKGSGSTDDAANFSCSAK